MARCTRGVLTNGGWDAWLAGRRKRPGAPAVSEAADGGAWPSGDTDGDGTLPRDVSRSRPGPRHRRPDRVTLLSHGLVCATESEVRRRRPMPARNIHHDAVIHALQADGWTITHDP